MLTLQELVQHRELIKELHDCGFTAVKISIDDEHQQALEIAGKMLDALIYQLENQSVSFTP